MRTYAATIYLRGAGTQRVLVQADDGNRARLMLEAQYGRGNVTNIHVATTSDLRRAGK